ncbi:MAG: RNA polymerase sigma factor [Brevundimonas sp.]
MVSHEHEVGQALVAHNRALLAYVRRRLASTADAEDVAQEAILRVLSRARVALITDPLSYAMRAARNIVIDRARRSANMALDDLGEAETPIDGGATPLESLEMNERLRLCQQALDAMPPLRREVFIRRRAGEESYERIASEMRMSVEAVQKHYSRAAQTLRKTAEAHHVD